MNKRLLGIKNGLAKRIKSVEADCISVEDLLEDFKLANPKYLKGFLEDVLEMSEAEYEEVNKNVFDILDRLNGLEQQPVVKYLEIHLMVRTLMNKTFIKEFVKYIKKQQAKEKEA